MITFKFLQWLHVVLALVNAIVFFIPKKLNSSIPSNAAGGFFIIAVVILLVMVVHVILLAIAIYYRKLIWLQIMAVILIPASLYFWYMVARYTTP